MRRLGLIVIVNTAAGVIPAAIIWAVVGGGAHVFWAVLFNSMVFSYSIGTLIFAAMQYLGPRYDKLPTGPHWLAEILTFVALGIVGTLIAAGILTHIPGSAGGARGLPFELVFRRSVLVALVMTLAIGLLVSYLLMQFGLLRSATLDLRTRQLEEERARKLATEARLASLESRIHPHFLFNSLNSIAALIREDPAAAEQMTERLAGLLRQTLEANTSALVPLDQELRLLRDYLEIEKTRFGDRLQFSIDAPAQLADLKVPLLGLQTLVENSVKYAVAPRREGGEIQIVARTEGDLAILEVSDNGPGFEASSIKPDHGLHNLQQRLSALFQGLARLDIARTGGRTVVSIRVPQRKASA